MIKAILFDIGGVLIRTEDLEPRRKWERRFGLPDGSLATLFFDSPTGQLAQIGQATTDDAWAYVGGELALSQVDLAQLRADFFAGDKLDRDLMTLIRSFRPRYKTGIISNALPDARESLKDRINGDTFDVIVFSAEEGVKKPDTEIYRRALQRIGVQASESIFVDDNIGNAQVARELGMQGIRFTRDLNMREELSRLGVAVE